RNKKIYDNEKYYNSVSCLDYITNYLNDYKNYLSVKNEIDNDFKNKLIYKDYLSTYSSIKLNMFNRNTKRLNQVKLSNYEEEIINKNRFAKPKNYKITISLLYQIYIRHFFLL
ncbi:MAG: hypothetical protein SOZ42_04160, partial [Candidatus Enterosoma sp.]|nr:hypothetical protein [Candidatus Enterosoma sp.]